MQKILSDGWVNEMVKNIEKKNYEVAMTFSVQKEGSQPQDSWPQTPAR